MLSSFRKLPSMTASVIELPRILARVPSQQLARATGRSPRTISNWLNGATTPSAPDLIAVMASFDDITNEVLALAGKRALTPDQIDKLRKVLNDL